AQAGAAGSPVDSAAESAPGSPGDRPLTRATGAAAEREAVLTRLYELVRERQRSLPAGSYTTHLFESGVDKIRKKTGEEAVELILARERGEIVAESADLLYHVLVLLRASEIEVTEILDELGARLARDMR
ncbi:MAG: phosphoribosyl-ATP diphosphatase, partial [Spirochaetaceae bacterium]